MPLAARHRADPLPELPPVPGLRVARSDDVALLARLQGRDRASLAARLASGHHAYVAWLDAEPAAWGWVATQTADIGELGATLRLPAGERYLWNFVTLSSHRGHGIYPRLLDAIVRAESAVQCWIAYAPENRASGAGIRKAGFTTLAALSFDAAGRPAVQERHPGGGAAAARLLGLPHVAGALAPCWRCVRARRAGGGGHGAMTCAAGTCRCDYQQPTSGCAA